MELKNPDKVYHTVEHGTYACQYHVMFCIKYRREVLVDAVYKTFKKFLLAQQELLNFKALEIDIRADHVHLLVDIDPRLGVVQLVKQLKVRSARLLKKRFPALKSRIPSIWNRSFFVTSVGTASLEPFKQFLDDQKHR